jgi:hypothetical protein
MSGPSVVEALQLRGLWSVTLTTTCGWTETACVPQLCFAESGGEQKLILFFFFRAGCQCVLLPYLHACRGAFETSNFHSTALLLVFIFCLFQHTGLLGFVCAAPYSLSLEWAAYGRRPTHLALNGLRIAAPDWAEERIRQGPHAMYWAEDTRRPSQPIPVRPLQNLDLF